MIITKTFFKTILNGFWFLFFAFGIVGALYAMCIGIQYEYGYLTPPPTLHKITMYAVPGTNPPQLIIEDMHDANMDITLDHDYIHHYPNDGYGGRFTELFNQKVVDTLRDEDQLERWKQAADSEYQAARTNIIKSINDYNKFLKQQEK